MSKDKKTKQTSDEELACIQKLLGNTKKILDVTSSGRWQQDKDLEGFGFEE